MAVSRSFFMMRDCWMLVREARWNEMITGCGHIERRETLIALLVVNALALPSTGNLELKRARYADHCASLTFRMNCSNKCPVENQCEPCEHYRSWTTEITCQRRKRASLLSITTSCQMRKLCPLPGCWQVRVRSKRDERKKLQALEKQFTKLKFAAIMSQENST